MSANNMEKGGTCRAELLNIFSRTLGPWVSIGPDKSWVVCCGWVPFFFEGTHPKHGPSLSTHPSMRVPTKTNTWLGPTHPTLRLPTKTQTEGLGRGTKSPLGLYLAELAKDPDAAAGKGNEARGGGGLTSFWPTGGRWFQTNGEHVLFFGCHDCASAERRNA